MKLEEVYTKEYAGECPNRICHGANIYHKSPKDNIVIKLKEKCIPVTPEESPLETEGDFREEIFEWFTPNEFARINVSVSSRPKEGRERYTRYVKIQAMSCMNQAPQSLIRLLEENDFELQSQSSNPPLKTMKELLEEASKSASSESHQA